VKDSEWLADLLRHGLLKASFIPPQPIRELRELTRYRKTLVQARAQARAQEANRLQQALESANSKLAAVAADVLGTSARAMLEALIAGQEDTAALAELARARLRRRLPELRDALNGRVRPHQRFLLRPILDHIDVLSRPSARVESEIA
jgi:transposase